MTHLRELENTGFIEIGKDKSKYIDVFHKHVNYAEEKINFKKVSSDELRNIILVHKNKNSLKVAIKNLFLAKKVINTAQKAGANYFSKVYGITSRTEIFKIKNNVFFTSESKTLYSSDRCKLKRCSEIKREEISFLGLHTKRLAVVDITKRSVAKLSKKRNSKAKKSEVGKKTFYIDFKNFKMDLKSFNVINKTRRSKNKADHSKEYFQEQLNQLHYIIQQENFVCEKSKEAFLAYHLINFETPILSDAQLSTYRFFQSTGTTREAVISAFEELEEKERQENEKEINAVENNNLESIDTVESKESEIKASDSTVIEKKDESSSYKLNNCSNSAISKIDFNSFLQEDTKVKKFNTVKSTKKVVKPLINNKKTSAHVSNPIRAAFKLNKRSSSTIPAIDFNSFSKKDNIQAKKEIKIEKAKIKYNPEIHNGLNNYQYFQKVRKKFSKQQVFDIEKKVLNDFPAFLSAKRAGHDMLVKANFYKYVLKSINSLKQGASYDC
jgi:hypothetical protein